MSKITIDGNTAAAHIAYALSEVAMIYPITPSSTMAEIADQKSTLGEKNIFGDTLKVVEMQSEGGASGALHGAIAGGALTTTFTASQGLLLMIPNMYKIAGELSPTVIHVSARAVATHALSIFGDHSDVMATRATGFALLNSTSVQEAMDMALVAHISTLKSSVPFLHFFDGFRTSHEINTINNIEYSDIAKLVPYDKIREFKSRSMTSENPHQQGTAQNPDIFFQNRESANQFYNQTPGIVQQVMNDVAKITGRQYHLFDYVGCDNPTSIIIMMGSGCNTADTTINYLNKTMGTKYGLIKVRLYRPFDSKALIQAIPNSVKNIAVLDRTKESGADGEPLYKDIITTLFNNNRHIPVYGGRYGLGSKEFTPSMVGAIFDNINSTEPKNNFTIGINDDITGLSLPINTIIHPTMDSVTSCKFYGYGGDGTVSANKSSIKIIGNNTDLNGQAYFEYDSKKSGNATICHLRFGKDDINESYLLDNVDFVAVHNQAYLTKYNVWKGLKPNGTLLLNTSYNEEELNSIIPDALKKYIATNNIKVYYIDAYNTAKKLGLGNKINLIMQSAFFKLIGIIDYQIAKDEMKAFAKKSYGSKGQKILDMNYDAIDSVDNLIKQLTIPTDWKDIHDCSSCTLQCKNKNKYYDEFIKPIQSLEGDSLPVSSFDPRGFVPVGTTEYEKRGIAEYLPCWNSEKCIQCNMCSFVCPHSAIRPYLIKEEDLAKHTDLITLPATAEPGYRFVMQVSPLDCTGCGVCASVCPSKDKAITMVDALDIREQAIKNYNTVADLPHNNSKVFKPNTVKGSQFLKPYFEFSGACAGCGETPYIKVICQLFGDHMVIANATGCSSIYGGSAPTCPYTKDQNGDGIAWANSLFEDNAEFGLGIKYGLETKKNSLRSYLNEAKSKTDNKTLITAIDQYLECNDIAQQREYKKTILPLLSDINDQDLIKNITSLKDNFLDKSMWIIGGDGWAYDIGYGGLDHILASGLDVNILVLDTEVYSNTGGQASKSTPSGAVAKFASGGKPTEKKDLAVMAMTYHNVYVAKVSMGANMNQFVTACNEAVAHHGVSLIIAYAPCINHGINMQNSQLEEKRAVEAGYWNLIRYNPDQPTNKFSLDSGEPKLDYYEFLNGENRYRTLNDKDEDRCKILQSKNKEESIARYNLYKSFVNNDKI